MVGGTRIACGSTACVGSEGYQCSASGTASLQLVNTCGSNNNNNQTCTKATCGTACGTISDGCGGTLQCASCGAGLKCNAQNACEPLCTGVSCGAGLQCDPMTGQCGASACARAHAVCGTVDGQSCGTCPGASTCASSKQLCVETVATLPFRYSNSLRVAGNRAFVTGYTTYSSMGVDLTMIDLTNKQQTSLATANVRSPLTVSGSDVLWTDGTGLRRLSPGSTQASTVAGMNVFCADLLVEGSSIYCSWYGDARLGVSYYGIKKYPLAGGAPTTVKSSLNNAVMAASGGYLFYVGTTDNFSSFSNLGAVDLTDNSDQVLASGGSLDRFILADADSFYFLQHGSGSTITRMPFTSTQGTDLLTSEEGIDRDSTVMKNGVITTYAKVGGVQGLWSVPVANPTQRTLLLDKTDLHIGTYGPTELVADGNGWLFITDNVVYRAIAPAL